MIKLKEKIRILTSERDRARNEQNNVKKELDECKSNSTKMRELLLQSNQKRVSMELEESKTSETISNLQQKLEELQSTINTEKDNHERDLTRLKKSHEVIMKQNNQSSTQLATIYSSKQKELETKLQTIQENFNQVELLKNQLQEQLDNNKRQMEELNVKHQTELQNLRENYNASLLDRSVKSKQENEQQITDMELRHQEQIQELNKKHSSEIKDLANSIKIKVLAVLKKQIGYNPNASFDGAFDRAFTPLYI